MLRLARRNPRRYCPGPRPPLYRHLIPPTWFWRPLCGYDLTGLARGAGPLTCPECGRTVSPARAIRSRRRLRLTRTAAALLALTIAALPLARSGRWIPYTPTVILAATERLPDSLRSGRLRAELQRRLEAGPLSPSAAAILIPKLIADLSDDDTPGNASRAIWILASLAPASVPALEAALDSPDEQQRQLAAHILRDVPGYPPTDALLRVTVDGLRDDALPYGHSRSRAHVFSGITNAREGVAYLSQHAGAASSFVEKGLSSQDPQQRLLCALTAAYARSRTLQPKALPILVERLKSSIALGEDGLAAAGLYRYGEAAEPAVRAMLKSTDDRQRRYARAILREWKIDRDDEQRIYHPTPPARDYRITAEPCDIQF